MILLPLGASIEGSRKIPSASTAIWLYQAPCGESVETVVGGATT
jgi:hypothetical protein